MNLGHHLATSKPEHPFAEYIRILGKGKKGSRPLTQDEAYRAMKMIMADEVLPEQLGAFIMLMRVKEETPEELAGFVLALRESCDLADYAGQADLDWSSYAGKRRHLPWFLLSALLLADRGVKVFMHGAPGPSGDRLYTESILGYLGLQPALSIDQSLGQLGQQNFCYLSLERFCPRLNDIIDMRSIMGLRSPVHTLVRLLNPLNADYSIQGIFHPNYRPVHQQAAALLQQPHAAVIKGEGGETEWNPDNDCLVQSVHQGELHDEVWPAFFSQRHVKPEQLEPCRLSWVWQGRERDEYGEASVIGTAAIALRLLGKAQNQADARCMATEWWFNRDLEKFAVR